MKLRSHFLIALVGFALVGFGAFGAAAEPDLARGEALYDLCSQCHGPAGEGSDPALITDPSLRAPAIAGLDEWYVLSQLRNFKSGARGINPDDVGGLRMYPMSLSLKTDEEIQAVAAWVAQMPKTTPLQVVEGGNPQKGAERYNALCSNCHGPDGAGNEQTKAPQLAGTSDWYLQTSLEKYRAGIRGSNPANPFGAVMRSFAGQLDDQAILDLVAYIQTLPGANPSN